MQAPLRHLPHADLPVSRRQAGDAAPSCRLLRRRLHLRLLHLGLLLLFQRLGDGFQVLLHTASPKIASEKSLTAKKTRYYMYGEYFLPRAARAEPAACLQGMRNSNRSKLQAVLVCATQLRTRISALQSFTLYTGLKYMGLSRRTPRAPFTIVVGTKRKLK